MELRPYGIHVALVEPAAIKTPAVDKSLGHADAIIGALPPAGVARYGAKLHEFITRGYARESAGSSPDVVAAAIEHALTARKPRVLYRVGAHARTLVTLPRLLPARLLDRVRLRMFGFSRRFGGELEAHG
jgi:NAD(P)-dependent dehydrogenase (short-subunit alcohol dehydrogenase family)